MVGFSIEVFGGKLDAHHARGGPRAGSCKARSWRQLVFPRRTQKMSCFKCSMGCCFQWEANSSATSAAPPPHPPPRCRFFLLFFVCFAGFSFLVLLAGFSFLVLLAGFSFLVLLAGFSFLVLLAGFSFLVLLAGFSFLVLLAGFSFLVLLAGFSFLVLLAEEELAEANEQLADENFFGNSQVKLTKS